MFENTSLRRLAAGVGAIALAAAGLLGGVAYADPGPGQEGAPDQGSIIVHKRVGTEGTRGNGTLLDPAPGTALPGVEFTVQRVGVWTGGACVAIDLTTNAGWTAAQLAVGPNPGAPATSAEEGKLCAAGSAVSKTTDVSGEATFDALALGLYYVTETNAPANVIDRALPFYVTIPFASKQGASETAPTDWLYNVNVYPKNATADKPTKTIGLDQVDLVVDADITWTIAQTIPTLSGVGSTFTEASIVDQLDPRLTYKSGAPVIENVTGDQLVAADYAFTNVNGKLTWVLSESGLSKLKANQGKKLSVELVTTVTSVAADNTTAGTITNDATVSFNDKPQTTETEPYSYWGNLTVTKQDVSSKAKLAGAEFKVFAQVEGLCPADMPTSGAIATGTSGTDGVVKWDSATPAESPLGLFIANSATPIANPTRNYCLYESVAPVGYVANAAPQTVTITTADNASLAVTVDNTKQTVPGLPLTGGVGTAVFGATGLVLVLGAIAGGTALRRRQSAN
ncbi:SpaH/EbpB family LPXTG-anchored major pilin [Tessaracoccus defluvii]|uniref:SpaH/EbpB family LPXTG-anchored major pilin n=1 Tax=Tessaracoccus defluvii TaxID=1285901 RepID=A0A7H0H440_9ACTN|nr:SpaH/EbpB family LPXTG-anchored major pilin [Tessaracoccus defluvii]QNP55306.1 SpaH/EbpB family LPXTG-anchored major pilin [Tessaracoccus defluvii]